MLADFLDNMQPKLSDYVDETELPKMFEEEDEEASFSHLLPNFDPSTGVILEYETFPCFEEDILYYIAGYTIGAVTKMHKIDCQACLKAVTSQNPRIREQDFTFLTNMKDFTGCSLVYCCEDLFDFLFKPMELYFRKLERQDLAFNGSNLKQKIIDEVERSCAVGLPRCHQMKTRLVTHYVRWRLKLSAHRTSERIEKDVALKQSGGEKGSRTMTQKKLAAEVK